jgi:hypothetical protein
VYSIQNHWGPGLCPSFGILSTVLKNAAFRRLDVFPFSGEGKEIPTLLGTLKRANPSHRKLLWNLSITISIVKPRALSQRSL